MAKKKEPVLQWVEEALRPPLTSRHFSSSGSVVNEQMPLSAATSFEVQQQ
jgi:hypothetical protein